MQQNGTNNSKSIFRFLQTAKRHIQMTDDIRAALKTSYKGFISLCISSTLEENDVKRVSDGIKKKLNR